MDANRQRLSGPNRQSGERDRAEWKRLTTSGPTATVVDDDDESQDFLTGSAGMDWFFFQDPEDKATDLKDEVFANDLDWIMAEL